MTDEYTKRIAEAVIEAAAAKARSYIGNDDIGLFLSSLDLDAIIASVPGPWMPIETAPKDRDVLLSCPKRGVVRGRWNDCKYATTPKPYWSNDRESVFGKHATRNDQPTHWIPLPPQPKESHEQD